MKFRNGEKYLRVISSKWPVPLYTYIDINSRLRCTYTRVYHWLFIYSHLFSIRYFEFNIISLGWTVRGSNPGERFSTSVQTGPGVRPASCTMGARLLPLVKRPGRSGEHPTSSSTQVKRRKEQYCHSPLSLHGLF